MRARRAETPARSRRRRGSAERPGATAARRSWPQSYRGLLRAQPGPERSGGTRPKTQWQWQFSRNGAGDLSEDLAVYAAAEQASAEGRAVVLATIVRCRGSTPRGCGSKMLVDPARGLTGTVGGGCGEGEVIEAARE